MQTQDSVIEILNDLIVIQHDRSQGYEKATEQVEDKVLKGLFDSMAKESMGFSAALNEKVTQLGGEPDNKASTGGKLFKMWMNIYNSLKGYDKAAILNTCEEGESVALASYEESLRFKNYLPEDVYQLMKDQYQQLVKARDAVRHLQEEIDSK